MRTLNINESMIVSGGWYGATGDGGYGNSASYSKPSKPEDNPLLVVLVTILFVTIAIGNTLQPIPSV